MYKYKFITIQYGLSTFKKTELVNAEGAAGWRLVGQTVRFLDWSGAMCSYDNAQIELTFEQQTTNTPEPMRK